MANQSMSLANVDIWPRPQNNAEKVKAATFEDFTGVLRSTNEWLQQNPTCEIISCETTRKKVYWTNEIFSGSSTFTPVSSTASWIHGLRLWVRTGSGSYPQMMGFTDIMPQPTVATDKYPPMDPMNAVVDKFNREQQIRPIEGRIISINTVIVSAGMNLKGGIDPLCTVYEDDFKKHRYQFLRVFFIAGPADQDAIGTADFTPVMTKDSGVFKQYPDFEALGGVMNKVGTWIKENRGIRVTNIQTIDAAFVKESVHPARMNSLATSDYKIEYFHECRISFVRVSYIIPRDQSRLPNYPPSMMYVPFIPQQTQRGDGCGKPGMYEPLPETVNKINEWVSSTRGRVLCVETSVMQQSQLIGTAEHVDATEFTGEWYVVRSKNSTRYLRHPLIYVLRVYLEQPVGSRPPLSLPDSPDCCTIL